MARIVLDDELHSLTANPFYKDVEGKTCLESSASTTSHKHALKTSSNPWLQYLARC